jgi:uncharacterized membrane protein YraQ (UPF0718 family)
MTRYAVSAGARLVMGWLWHALTIAGSMTWEILWALILGFMLSALVQAVVRRETVVRALGSDSPGALVAATALGIASSCSYAAVALARSLFRKGASFAAAMVFEIASTNLVIELGIVMALLMGWQFTAAEYVGGALMIVAVAVLFRVFLRQRLVDAALKQANKGIAGSMEGHAAMDMSVAGPGTFWRRLASAKGFTAVSHIFVMELAAIWRDIVVGLLITGALAAWVPMDFWKSFFLTDHPVLAGLWGPLVGPIVAVVSFVCSIGNVPLAAVLWNGGISFGGVVAFIFADLIILPILNIYRKYYGWKMAAFITATFYASMVLAGYAVELIFNLLHLVPGQRTASVIEAHIAWNYTTWLNIAFLILAAVLLARFFTSGGLPMLTMMGGSPDETAHHRHTSNQRGSDAMHPARPHHLSPEHGGEDD